MLTKEKKIRDLLAQGKRIYEIEEAQVFRTFKPSKTEPGQALSIKAHVALAQSGIGSLGITDDMFDFDENISVDEAIEKSGATLLTPGVSSLYDLINYRIAMLQRQFKQYGSENSEFESDSEKESAQKPSVGPKDESADAA